MSLILSHNGAPAIWYAPHAIGQSLGGGTTLFVAQADIGVLAGLAPHPNSLYAIERELANNRLGIDSFVVGRAGPDSLVFGMGSKKTPDLTPYFETALNNARDLGVPVKNRRITLQTSLDMPDAEHSTALIISGKGISDECWRGVAHKIVEAGISTKKRSRLLKAVRSSQAGDGRCLAIARASHAGAFLPKVEHVVEALVSSGIHMSGWFDTDVKESPSATIYAFVNNRRSGSATVYDPVNPYGIDAVEWERANTATDIKLDYWDSPNFRQVLEWCNSLMKPFFSRKLESGRSTNVLDLGCFDGRFLFHQFFSMPDEFLGYAITGQIKLMGFDTARIPIHPFWAQMDKEIIERRYGNLEQPLPYVDGSIETLVSTFVFSYVEPSKREDMVREISRICSPDTRFLLVTHHPRSNIFSSQKEKGKLATELLKTVEEMIFKKNPMTRSSLQRLENLVRDGEDYIRKQAVLNTIRAHLHKPSEITASVLDEIVFKLRGEVDRISMHPFMTEDLVNMFEKNGWKFAERREFADLVDGHPFAYGYVLDKTRGRVGKS